MSRTRAAEHLKEGLPWMLGATASCLYFMDAFQNDGRAAAAVWEWVYGAGEMSKSSLRRGLNPALELMESLEKETLKHSDDERFLNKPMHDQITALLEWLEEEDYERGLHYLALFSKDRGSPQTDWPLNEEIIKPELVEKIVEVRRKGKMGSGLFGASLAALCQAKENANVLLTQDNIDEVVRSLRDSSESDVDTVFNLKLLALLAANQPASGKIEKLLVQNGEALPHLLSILQDDHTTVFEARYPSQLLSCIIRCYPEVLRTELNGKYLAADGHPLTIFNTIKEGCRFKETWALQYYIRLMRDCFVADEQLAVREFQKVDLTSLLVGLLQNNWGYLEILPSLTRLLKIMVHNSPEPGKLLSYTDFLVIVSSVVEKSGKYNHGLVLELMETVDMAVRDASLPPSYLETKRPILERFRKSCKHILSHPVGHHVTRGWVEKDNEAVMAARVLLI
eukprot:TRINITY_DN16991_c0_g1_i1.p1 TRINITY_DN16991_c0_g1~~TRINITY_DN16991_c0_g1_i1.p1  ORF type:complete len:452 (+),score=143.61 TRINITY_DN16991_c0_g1_i1:50-1405(+)